ncbi:Eco57I restriction-modification methylase domain-containing protein [Leptotrichia massiliensis]|uniref:Eco57I restriction-modification methylase domain-containing protein n=1 Tax=Leptotrichia massiliensis TaxID=1852388 RepID=UPI0028D06B6E|nr:N-6 DNA methylase [Leptotrichia massiliensis]
MESKRIYSEKDWNGILEKFNLSEEEINEKKKILNKYIEMHRNGDLKNHKEENIKPSFFMEVFKDILGYNSITSGKFELYFEKKTKMTQERSDACLGFFEKDYNSDRVKAVIELKGPYVDLDKEQVGRKNSRSPVKQAFDYRADIGKSCEYIIVSNIYEIRFYQNDYGRTKYEVFNLEMLEEEENFKKFYCLFSKEFLFGNKLEEKSFIDKSFEEISLKEEKIKKEFYNKYKEVREKIFSILKLDNDNTGTDILIEKTQKLLDRFLFIKFAEATDPSLLPKNIYKKYINGTVINGNVKKFQGFKLLCDGIDVGNKEEDINGYNGGLFKRDKELEKLVIKNEIFDELERLAEYDYSSDLNENILGHVFEKSMTDLEKLKANQNNENYDKKDGNQKRTGAFYTPKYIVQYIVKNAIDNWLEDRKKELGYYNLPEVEENKIFLKGYEHKHKHKEKKLSIKAKRHLDFWNKYREKVKNIKVIDPACGSGAFLVEVFNYLKEIRGEINNNILNYNVSKSYSADMDSEILLNNIYGVDVNKEAAEITKLSLWLKTANKNKPLENLDKNVKCGNSLIDDKEIAGEVAFNWDKEFPEVFENGGFDIVVGNPPYGVNFDDKTKKYLLKFDKLVPDYEIYIYFISLYRKILKRNGYLSYIFSNTFLSTLYGKKYRKSLLKEVSIKEIVDLSNDNTFIDARVRTIIFSFKNSIENNESTFTKIENRNFKQFKKYSKDKVLENVENIASLFFQNRNEIEIVKKIKENVKIKDFFEISQGLIPYDKHKGHNEYTIKNRIWHSNTQKDKTYKKELKGGDVSQYLIKWNGELWISYGEWLAAPRERKFFVNERILVREITNKRLFACYTDKEFYNTPSLINIINEKNILELKYILTLINSTLLGWYHNKTSPKANKGLFPKILVNDVRNLPIKEISLKDQQLFIEKADKILSLNKKLQEENSEFQKLIAKKFGKKLSNKLKKWYLLNFSEFEKELKTEISPEWAKYFLQRQEKILKIKNEIDKIDREIDKMVYELYGLNDDEIKIIEENL